MMPQALRTACLRRIAVLALLAPLSAAACSSSAESDPKSSDVGGTGGGVTGTPPGPPASFEPDETTFDITWKPEAKLVESAKDLLIEESEASGTFTYRFRPEATAIAALAPDDVVILAGIAYRRVVSVDTRADAIVLTAKRTKLTDAVGTGTMAWKRMFDFGNPGSIKQASAGIDPQHLHPFDITTGLSYSGNVDGFDITGSLRPNNGRLNISLSATKTVEGRRSIALTAEGYLESFQSEGRLVFDPSGLVDFRYGSNQVRGELKVKAAAVDGGVSQNLLNVPLRIQIPLDIGPVPVLVTLGANINVTAAMNITPNTAEAEVTIGFNTTQGVQVTGTQLSPTGSVSGEQLDVAGGGSTASVAAGLTACVEAPRVEMAFLGELASVGLTQNNCASTVYTFDPACNEVSASMVGRGLAQLGFMGVTLAQADVELYSKRTRRAVGNCGPDEP